MDFLHENDTGGIVARNDDARAAGDAGVIFGTCLEDFCAAFVWQVDRSREAGANRRADNAFGADDLLWIIGDVNVHLEERFAGGLDLVAWNVANVVEATIVRYRYIDVIRAVFKHRLEPRRDAFGAVRIELLAHLLA